MLIVVGTNHKYSPIEIREKLSFSRKQVQQALIALLSQGEIGGGIILSTCNRVEFYASVQDIEIGIRSLKGFLSSYHCQELSRIEPYLYTYIGKEAILHLFRVACGLDSQIIGESQIAEQVKFAYTQSRELEASDKLLDIVFQNTLKISLEIRQETGIAQGGISIGTLVIDLIKKRFSSIENKKVLIIGVGKIAELVSRCLKDENVKIVFIANRTFGKAMGLAESIDAEVVRFDQLKEKLLDTDIIISATSSPHLILKKEDILEALNHRPSTIDHRPLLIIDLALPRDVDPEIKYIEGVCLFYLDDLDSVLEDNLRFRRQSIPTATERLKKEVEELCLREHLDWEHAEALLP